MAGTSDTQFSPDSALTKAAYAQVLYNIAGRPEVDSSNVSFDDVDSTAAYLAAAVWADSNGILKADNGRFSPDSKISAVKFAISLVRFAAAGSFNITKVVKTLTFAFNIVKDFGVFGLNNTVTRAEAAQRLADYCVIK